MRTEKEKMLAGEPYNAADAELSTARSRCRALLKRFNDSTEEQTVERRHILNELFAHPSDVSIVGPFYCDYGWNIKLGKGVQFNFDCVVLDVMPVTIGDRCLFGPKVQLYTPTHPIDAAIRASGVEGGEAITIGDDVWIGGGSVVCPGVTIGSRTVIGAGSVVSKSIPSDVVAVGNPCRVIRHLKEDS